MAQGIHCPVLVCIARMNCVCTMSLSVARGQYTAFIEVNGTCQALANHPIPAKALSLGYLLFLGKSYLSAHSTQPHLSDCVVAVNGWHLMVVNSAHLSSSLSSARCARHVQEGARLQYRPEHANQRKKLPACRNIGCLVQLCPRCVCKQVR